MTIVPDKNIRKGINLLHSDTDPPLEFHIRECKDGFEFFFHESWYSAKDGLVTKMVFSPDYMEDIGEGPSDQSEFRTEL